MNQYAELTPIPYISQYIPTDVNLLFNIAKDAYEQNERTRQEVTNQLKEWGKFNSLSSIDNQNYYNIAVKPVQDIIAQGAANPELMKTAAYRNALTNQIANTDYASLAKLETSAKNLDTRAKMIAEMKAKGLYEDWMDDPKLTVSAMGQWNTLQDGVMTDLSPIEYKSLKSISDQYVANLKPTFYKGVDPNTGQKMPFTNWMSVTQGDLERSLADNLNEIKNTAQGAAWYNRFAGQFKRVYPNASQADTDKFFIKELVSKQQDRIQSTPVTDQVGLAMWKAAQDQEIAKMKIRAQRELVAVKSGIKNATSLGFTAMSTGVGGAQLKGKINQALQRNPDIVAKANKNTQIAIDRVLTGYDRLAQAEPDSEFSKLYTRYKNELKANSTFNSLTRDQATQELLKLGMQLQQALNQQGINISNNPSTMQDIQSRLQQYQHALSYSDTSGMKALIKQTAEGSADKLDASIGISRTGNAFSRFDIEFDSTGKITTKDNSLKTLIDDTYREFFTPLQGATNDIVESRVMSNIVGKPLDITRALTPAQFLGTSPEFTDYLKQGLRIKAEHQYRNYKGADKDQKIATAENAALEQATYDRDATNIIGTRVWFTPDYKQDLNLEKQVADGRLPSPTVTKVNGYVDTNDGSRVYDVTVELPMKVLEDNNTGLGMAFHVDGDAVRSKLKKLGYKTRVAVGQGKNEDETREYVQFHMSLPVQSNELQEYYSDAYANKGVVPNTVTKNVVNTNDQLLQLQGFEPGIGSLLDE